MLGQIVKLQLGRIKKRVEARYKIPFTYSDDVVKLVVSRCTESESGGRMIDAILTNTMLPDISREFLKHALMEGTEEPDNPVAQHQLAACLGEQVPERASNAYVEQVFDSFAGSFDAKLEMLHYRAPELVTQALAAAAGPAQASLDIVDAGCGTGLCGPLLKPWARHLAGCDLSEGMLRRAAPRQVYDALHKAELVHYLYTQPGRFDAVVSADTLCYFGDLHEAIAAAQRCLRPGGWLIFTVEALPEGAKDLHHLQGNGRYAHGQAHLQAAIAAAGLSCMSIQADVLRHEAGRPVAGWLVSAAKP
jgi:predicted TPR repeat methyltransferase